MIDISVLDFVLLNVCSYLLGIATGLTICCKYRDQIMRSRSFDNLKQYNHQNVVTQPTWDSPVLASAPPPTAPNPIKLTIDQS
jgi:hypothetical protein